MIRNFAKKYQNFVIALVPGTVTLHYNFIDLQQVFNSDSFYLSYKIRHRFMKYISIFVSVMAAGVTMSCAHKHEESGHEKGEGHDHHDEIVMSVADATRFGVEVEAVAPTPFTEVVKVIGEVLPASSDQIVVSAPTSGIISFAKCTELGEKVASGHLIATISASGITGGDANEVARKEIAAAKRELDRLAPLLKDGIITKKEYNDALRAYEVAKSSYSPAAATGRAVSSIYGVISSLFQRDGAYVDAGQPIAAVSSSDRLTLRALLPASYVDFLPKISGASIKPSYGGNLIALDSRNGKLLSTSVSSGDATPGYIPVYFSFDNHGDVVPGTPAEVYIKGMEKAEMITVPVCAISEQQGEKFVFIKVEDHAYKKQNVVTGRSDGARVEIVLGLNEGDSVVTKGSSFVRLAETSTVVPEGHSHSH